jgi:glycosyltransferase involved in cell wall biosynthesis
VGAAIASLAQQTYRDFEIVLVDDGSRDNTVARARAEAPNLRVLTPGRVGLVAALETGRAACSGELIARMDADDLCTPDRLAEQVALLDARPDVDLVGCLVRCTAVGGLGEGYARYEAWLNRLTEPGPIARELFVESPLPHPSVLFRATAVEAVGGYCDRGWPEDYDLWLRLARAGSRFAKVNRVLLEWRDRPERHSRNHERYQPDAFLRCKAHYLARGPLAAEKRVVIWGAGRVGRRLSKYLLGEGVTTAAFVDIDPIKIGRTVRDAPVVEAGELARFRDHLLVAAVGSWGARELIRKRLRVMGWAEGADFWCAA